MSPLSARRPHPWLRIVVVLTAAATVVAVTSGLLYAKRQAQDAVAAQRDLALVAGHMSDQDSQEWRAIAGQDIGAVRTEMTLSRRATTLLLTGPLLATAETNVDVRALAQAAATYATAVDRELVLLEAGDHDAAVEVDESRVDPAYEVVITEVAEARASLASTARSAKLLSDAGIVLIVLGSALLVVLTDRRRRAADRGRHRDAEHLALHDPLTGLPNRRLFLDRIDQTLLRQQKGNGSACLLYLDLDDFKAVNDSLGHGAGDELLIAATQRLEGAVQPADTLCRLGGDEFAVLLEDADSETGRLRAERLLALLTEDFFISGRSVRISASVGVAVVDGSWPIASDVLRAADQAMYGAKRAGKGRVVVHEENMSVVAARHGRLSQALTAGLSTGEVTVEYQPIVDLVSGGTVAVEALARWRSPVWGRVSPAEFIPVAEETVAIDALGRLVLATACRDIALLNLARAPHLEPLGVAVNISTVQLRRGDGLLADVAAALRGSGLPPTLLTVEITESTALSIDCLPVLRELRALGVGLALDDFGTGFASLTHVTSLPITQLKIDQTFVKDLVDQGGGALVSAILALGHQLELDVVAEGVETEVQRLRLEELGCSLAQGYLFERAVDIESLNRLLHLDLLLSVPLASRAAVTTPLVVS